MAKHTNRDGIWTTALRLTQNGKAVTAEKVADAVNVSERTAADCLLTMADNGFLDRELKGGRTRFVAPDGTNVWD